MSAWYQFIQSVSKMTTDSVPPITYNSSGIRRFWTAIDVFGIRPIILILLSPPNGATLVPLLASIFSLSFLAKSSKMIHTEASVSIRIGKGVPMILMYTFNSYVDLCYFGVKV